MKADIYMYIESINKVQKVDEMRDVYLEDVWYRCKLYFEKNPHDYLVRDLDTGDWYIWTEYYFEDVA